MGFQIILCDLDETLCEAWRQKFRHPRVRIEHNDFFEIDADAYVAPANSHGIMDGGFDRLLRLRFPGIEVRVQRAIDGLGGMLPVGETVIVETDDADVPFVVCAPTMVSPTDIRGTRNVYEAMAAILRGVQEFNEEADQPIEILAIPGLGTGVGRLSPFTAASQMSEAFFDFLS